MNCPNCQASGIPETASFCHNCGHPLAIARRFSTVIQQDVETNRGRVIGIETDHLHGDVYASGDFYQVQVYALSSASREKDPRQFFKQRPAPYLALKPYTANDALLFKGREDEKWRLISRIGDQPLVTLYGAHGVGKTSLLAAAVIPELARKGALVLHLHEYHQPLSQVIAAAVRSSPELTVELPESASLEILLSQLYAQAQGTMVLVLDHLEIVFQPDFPVKTRDSLFQELSQALQVIGPEYLRLVFSVEQGFEGYLGGYESILPDVLRAAVFLQPLDLKQAAAAIAEPPGREGQDFFYNFQYARGLVENRLIGDLDRLSEQTPGFVHPPHLQIVCDTLYSAAKAHSLLTVDETLYLQELHGANRIVDSFLYKKLNSAPEQVQQAVQYVLRILTSPTKTWFSGASFSPNGLSQSQISSALDTLQSQGLLVQRRSGAQVEYALTSQDLKSQFNSLVSLREGRSAGVSGEDLLSFLWARWETEHTLPGLTDLLGLKSKIDQSAPDAAQALLLLRSAFSARGETASWFARLRTAPQAELLVTVLEKSDPDAQAELSKTSSEALLADFQEVLLPKAAPPDALNPGTGSAFGLLAHTAVTHRDWAVRRSAAASLSLLGGHESASRLQLALEKNRGGLSRLWRKGELFGSLSEANPAFLPGIPSQPPLDRFFIQLWQLWNRIILDRHRVSAHLAGGALGAGLGLGTLRLLSGLLRLNGSIYGPQYFFIFSIYGAMLGLAAVLGHALGRRWYAKDHPAPRQPAAAGSLLAALFFGLAGMLQMGFAGFYRTGFSLTAPFGFLAGLGISAALVGQPDAAQSKDRRGWGWRLGLGALTMLVIQGFFFLFPQWGGVLTFTLGNSLTREMALDWTDQIPALTSLLSPYELWGDILVLIDMALVGIVLVGGTTLGMLTAERIMKAWLEAIGQSESRGE